MSSKVKVLLSIVLLSIPALAITILSNQSTKTQDISTSASEKNIQNLALSATATASNYVENKPPYQAIDGKLGTTWNSGGLPNDTTNITIDLQDLKQVSNIRLLPNQTPNGKTHHKVFLGQTLSNLKKVHTHQEFTKTGEWISIDLNKVHLTRYVRIKTLESPSWVAWTEIEIYPPPSEAYANLKYFGYWGVVFAGNNYIDEIIPGTVNVAQVSPPSQEEDMRKMLTTAREKDVDLIMDVIWYFWGNLNGGGLGDGSAKLKPKDTRLAQWDRLQSHIDKKKDTISYYYFDEPYWRGIAKQDFLQATEFIKTNQPDKKVMTVLACPSLQDGEIDSDYLQNVDAVGFDYYYTFFNKYTEQKWDNCFDKLLSITPRDKEIWLVPEAFTSSNAPDKLAKVFKKHVNEALNNDRIKGILPFIYESNDGAVPNLKYALRDYIRKDSAVFSRKLHNLYRDIGQKIVSNNSAKIIDRSDTKQSSQSEEGTGQQVKDNKNTSSVAQNSSATEDKKVLQLDKVDEQDKNSSSVTTSSYDTDSSDSMEIRSNSSQASHNEEKLQNKPHKIARLDNAESPNISVDTQESTIETAENAYENQKEPNKFNLDLTSNHYIVAGAGLLIIGTVSFIYLLRN